MLTIVFATFNGEKTLPRLLDSYCELDIPVGGCSIIVVNNASTDSSADIIQKYTSRLPITLLDQPDRGKNKALNLALPHVKGDWVVFTDDDIVPQRGWLQAYMVAAENHPECQIFGGSILPLWPFKPEKWVLDKVNLGVVFAATNPDLTDEVIPPGKVWGGNMMVRADIFRQGYRFNEDIGPTKGQYIMGSETEFTTRLHQNGSTCRFVPHARVQHIIRPNQLSLNWILGRAIRNGKAEYFQTLRRQTANTMELFGMPRWVLTKTISEFFDALLNGWKFNPASSFPSMWNLYRHLGYISAHIQHWIQQVR